MKYYNTNKIDKKNAIYNIIFGERSNGKTFALLKKGIENYIKNNKQFAYIRRWKEDITGSRAQLLFSGINASNIIEKLTNGKFKGIHYYSRRWYLCNYDENGKVIYSDSDIMCFSFSLSDNEHDKSTSFPHIDLVIFDEFLTNKLYLNDEFILFMNTISTIIRKRDNVKIYMLGNTVNKYCPYFAEMGLINISKMKQGSIDVYKYGNTNLTVAVEYCSPSKINIEHNKYFAFDNPKLEMITSGKWELKIYPHLPIKFRPKDILLNYFIIFDNNIYHCKIVYIDNITFTYIHLKTSVIKNDYDIVYSLEYNINSNYNRSIFKPTNKIQKKIMWYFEHGKVYYQNNEVGDSISNYLKICKRM